MYKLYFLPEARKTFLALDKQIQMRIKEKMDFLTHNPLSIGKLKSFRRLSGVKNGYRMRVARYRVLCLVIVQDEQIKVCSIFLKKSDVDYRKVMKKLLDKGVFNKVV